MTLKIFYNSFHDQKLHLVHFPSLARVAPSSPAAWRRSSTQQPPQERDPEECFLDSRNGLTKAVRGDGLRVGGRPGNLM